MNPTDLPEESQKSLIDGFHWLYHRHLINGTWNRGGVIPRWMGVPIIQCPFDAWVFQEIIFETRPNIIIETGTYHGGGAFFYTTILDLLGLYYNHTGTVITIDVDQSHVQVDCSSIIRIEGSSTDKDVVKQVKGYVKKHDKVMVILDSLHTYKHIKEELKIYSKLVSLGSYLIVCDTNLGNNPIRLSDQTDRPSPVLAVGDFLKTNRDFVIDKGRECHLFTFNPDGYLLRKGEEHE